ncbi:hypothetical protein M9Y10_041063 [Tritrichomonas musculus]|uniref:Right handed beta helix domain-containing protein n=1 Tax=Tritrichomonas musculus TaxID=1915356 RepID=A0ABR2K424_9EUKA
MNDFSTFFSPNKKQIKEECYNNNIYTHRIEISINVCIMNCIFRSIGDSSTPGGAVYVSINNRNENENIIQNSTFINCFSNRGGAFYISSQYDINIIFKNCSFSNNAVSIKDAFGGAIFINSINKITFENCNFQTNSVNSEYKDGNSQGGSIYSSNSNININKCIFNNNQATSIETDSSSHGAAVHLTSSSSGELNECLFDDNSLSKIFNFGCVSIEESTINVKNCNFTNNKANSAEGNLGSALYLYESNVTFDSCLFKDNFLSSVGQYSSSGGGAIYISSATMRANNCVFQNNSAYASGIESFSGGGAITSSLGEFTIENCRFVDNIAGDGEVLFIVEKQEESHLIINKNIFERNINTMSQMKSLFYLDLEDGLASVNSFTNNKVYLFNTDRILLFDCYEDNSVQRKWIFNGNCLYPLDQQYFKSDTLDLYDESGQNLIEFNGAFSEECTIQPTEKPSEITSGFIVDESSLFFQSDNAETSFNDNADSSNSEFSIISSPNFFDSEISSFDQSENAISMPSHSDKNDETESSFTKSENDFIFSSNSFAESSDIDSSSLIIESSDVDSSNIIIESNDFDSSNLVIESSDVESSSSAIESSDIDSSNLVIESSDVESSSSAIESNSIDSSSSVIESNDFDSSNLVIESSDVESSSSAIESSDIDSSNIIIESNDFDSSNLVIESNSIDSSSSVIDSNNNDIYSTITSDNNDKSNIVIESNSNDNSSLANESDIQNTFSSTKGNDNNDDTYSPIQTYTVENTNTENTNELTDSSPFNETSSIQTTSTETSLNRRSYSLSITFSITYFRLRSVSYSFSYSIGNIYTVSFHNGEYYSSIITRSMSLYFLPYIIYYLSPSYVPSYISFFIRKPRITSEQLIGIACGSAAVFFFILYIVIRIFRKTYKVHNDYYDWCISEEEIDDNLNENSNNEDLVPNIKYNDDSSVEYNIGFWL